MKKHISWFTFLFLLVVPSTHMSESRSRRQFPKTKVLEALLSVKRVIGELTNNPKDRSKEDIRLLEYTEKSVDVLIDVGEGKEAPRAYVYSVQLNQSLLERYGDKNDHRSLTVAASDFDTKASTAEANPDQPYEMINVSAYTKDAQGQVQNGYRVLSALAGQVTSGFTPSTSQSSPASLKLVPGDHIIFAQKGQFKTHPSKLPIGTKAKPGSDGTLEEDIDVDVP